MTIELKNIICENEEITKASFIFDWHFRETERLDPHNIITNGTNKLSPDNFKLDEEKALDNLLNTVPSLYGFCEKAVNSYNKQIPI